MKKTRLFGYCRVSTQRQADRGYSLDDQERRIRSYVDTYYDDGSYSLSVLRDEGRSGKNLDRPMMRQLISEAQKNHVDVIIFYCLNRITRSVKDTIYLMEMVNACGIQFISISENLDTNTAMGRYFITTLAALAQLEREQDGERSARGLLEGAKQGHYVKPSAPFGYYRDPDSNKTLVVDEYKAMIVKSIFESIAYKGESVNSIAYRLRTDKICGYKWDEGHVYKIVSNRIYYGCLEVQGQLYENHSPAIIDKSLFDEVQERINYSRKKNRHHYLFKSKIRCSKCNTICKIAAGTSMTGEVHKYYRCPVCKKQISEKKILNEFIPEMNELLRQNYYHESMEALQIKYALVKNKLNNLTYAFVQHGMDRSMYEQMMESLSEDRSQIEKDILMMKKGIREVEFTRFGFIKQLEIVNKYVRIINVDMKSKNVDVVFREEKKEDEELLN